VRWPFWPSTGTNEGRRRGRSRRRRKEGEREREGRERGGITSPSLVARPRALLGRAGLGNGRRGRDGASALTRWPATMDERLARPPEHANGEGGKGEGGGRGGG